MYEITKRRKETKVETKVGRKKIWKEGRKEKWEERQEEVMEKGTKVETRVGTKKICNEGRKEKRELIEGGELGKEERRRRKE